MNCEDMHENQALLFGELTELTESGKMFPHDWMIYGSLNCPATEIGKWYSFEWADYSWTGLTQPQIRKSFDFFKTLGVVDFTGGSRPRMAVLLNGAGK